MATISIKRNDKTLREIPVIGIDEQRDFPDTLFNFNADIKVLGMPVVRHQPDTAVQLLHEMPGFARVVNVNGHDEHDGVTRIIVNRPSFNPGGLDKATVSGNARNVKHVVRRMELEADDCPVSKPVNEFMSNGKHRFLLGGKTDEKPSKRRARKSGNQASDGRHGNGRNSFWKLYFNRAMAAIPSYVKALA